MKTVLGMALLIVAAIVVGASVWLWTPDRSRSALEAAYLQSPRDLIDIGGTLIHVRDTGPRDAPAVVMLHGTGSSLHTFEPWAQLLDGNYRVIRFDLPGSGLSGPDPTGIYTDARSMEILAALLDRLGVERATLVGNSIGGRLAWRFAAAHPERVDRLVLISPDGFASPGFAYGRAPEISAVLWLIRYALPKALLRPSIAAAYGNPDALSEETLERYHALLLAPGNRDALIERLRQTILVDPEPILRNIKSPVLLLWGDKDGMIPVGNAADYRRALPDSRLVTFANLGHVPHEEAPDVSIVPLREFLAE